MTQKMPPVTLNDFSYGLNDRDDPSLIPNQALTAVNNFIIDRGGIKLRHGYVKHTTAPISSSLRQIYTFYKNNGSNELLGVSNGLLFKESAGALEQIPFINALSSSKTQMLTYKARDTLDDVVLVADGGKLKVYNQTDVKEVTPHVPVVDSGNNINEPEDPGLNDLVNLTNFRSIAIKQDRIYALAHPTVKNRLSFCHHDPRLGYAVYDYWPATHFYDMVSEQNDEAITLRTFRDAIIVFNRRTMWAFYGDGRTVTDYELKRINVPSGLLAEDSVAYVGNNLFYLSDTHVYALFSTERDYISAEIVSRDIENTIKAIPLEDRKRAVGAFHDNKYYLSFPDGTTLVLDTTLPSPMNKYGSWTVFSNIKANSFLERDGYLHFSSDTGFIFKLDPEALNDDGAEISGMFRTKRLDFGFPVQVKKFKRFWIVAKQYDSESSTFDFNIIIDDIRREINSISTDESGVWDEGDWDEVNWDFKDVVQKRLRVSERGKTIQFEVTHATLDEPLTVFQIVSLFKLKKAK
ncbi:hypothetical protein [Paenibacillus spongiae]|uniref:Phage tail protein n=1 Tax=Paenibacillus spongiae TaxID=2909671 RepID=A0ABY5SFD5_9BACL|nr:hypothetical protein [Paenibacillus spongiae]UVI31215.1 hypothetical protein L1F29_05055 [Paenibacillus spongiae]